MLNHYRAIVLRVPFVLAMAAGVVILFTPASGVPTAPPGTDKVIHLTLFTTLAVTGHVARIRAPVLIPGLCCYAVASEGLQAVLPIGRSGGWVDAVVDLLGVTCGWVIIRLCARVRGNRSG